MRHDVTFTSQGLRCSAWLYLPDAPADAKSPAIVMAHGFSCVKEQRLDPFARRFRSVGFATLLFDFRHFGRSGGQPRGQLFPLEQIEDYRNAISWLSEHPQVDPERVGAWGTSFSGGLMFHLAAFDRRVKAAVAQVPNVVGHEHRQALDPAGTEEFGRFLLKDRAARYRTGVVNYLKVVAPEGEPCVLSGQESYEALTRLSEEAPSWKNQVTVESMEKIREFDPTQYIHLVAPTPMLIIGAERDCLIPISLLEEAFARAGEPKEKLLLPCRHFDVYDQEPWCSTAADAAASWFRKHLIENARSVRASGS